MSRWIEVSLSTDGEAAEAIAQELQEYCHQGISIEQADIEVGVWDDGDVPPATRVIIRGYFRDDETATETRKNIERTLGILNMMYPMPQPAFAYVNEEDWAEAWKVHYHPVRLGKRILIRPRWIEVIPEPDDLIISLDPGMAFGTGTHPTTQLCLEAMEDLVKPGLDVLDLGCGSGILAIAAAKLGATNIVGVDIDEVAVQVTLENAQDNGVGEHITAFQGSLESLITSARRYDLALVNILAKVIIPMCEQGLGQLVRPGGKAIFSGLIETQVEEVEEALRKTGLTPVNRRQISDWMLIEAIREPS
jgi:ribosomal protein L11 methyltransferase